MFQTTVAEKLETHIFMFIFFR